MHNKWISKIGRGIAVALAAIQLAIPAQATDLCIARGYTLGYFNSVWKTPVQAANELATLRDTVGPNYANEPVQYEVFYNHIGLASQGASLLTVGDVFAQRASELDPSGALQMHWEFVWSMLAGEPALTDLIASVYPQARQVFDQMSHDIQARLTTDWTNIGSDASLWPSDATHAIRLEALALQRQKIVLVSHSQGSVYLNRAYDRIPEPTRTSSVGAAYIAPATTQLHGGYLLADIDAIVNAARAAGTAPVPNPNLFLQPANGDTTGHSLVATYLDPTRAGRNAARTLIQSAMQPLVAPAASTSNVGNVGSFTVTLTWDGTGDVDLHTFEPNGAHVYYANKQGQVGFLDVDNVTALGPEHYYATCDYNLLQEGTYRIGINNYARALGRIATVQVSSSRDGVIATRTLGVGPVLGSAGNPTPIPVFNVTVSKNPANGTASYTASAL